MTRENHKAVRSYEAVPREYRSDGGYHHEVRPRPTPWSDARLASLLRLYGREVADPRTRDVPLLRRIERAVAYLFARKDRAPTGRKRKAPGPRAKAKPPERVRPSYIWRKT